MPELGERREWLREGLRVAAVDSRESGRQHGVMVYKEKPVYSTQKLKGGIQL